METQTSSFRERFQSITLLQYHEKFGSLEDADGISVTKSHNVLCSLSSFCSPLIFLNRNVRQQKPHSLASLQRPCCSLNFSVYNIYMNLPQDFPFGRRNGYSFPFRVGAAPHVKLTAFTSHVFSQLLSAISEFMK